jgi:Protein of unknown function (DUF1588)/Protein of unknown function (DUF1592)/Protein of unknown function (DUF1595)/Protein of unknown function (DUF1587)
MSAMQGTKAIALSVCIGIASACTGTTGSSSESRTGGKNTGGKNAGGNAGGTAETPEECTDAWIKPRVWRLTLAQYANTVRNAFGVDGLDLSKAPGDGIDPHTGFANGSQSTVISGPLTTMFYDVADQAARKFGDQLAKQYPCVGGVKPDAKCLTDFITKVGYNAFRRPLETPEIERYQTLFNNNQLAHGSKGAAEIVTHAMLLSPDFLYRTELGDGSEATTLTQHEIASALSYGIADQPPTAELLAAADRGELGSVETRQQFADALASTEGARNKMADFIFWQLKLNLLDLKADALGQAKVASLVGENRNFVRALMSEEIPTLTALYSDNHSVVDPSIAEIYGKGAASGKIELPADERFGIFTQPGWLTATHGPIFRGRLVRENFLCMDLPLPPANAGDLITQLPKTDPEATAFEKWQVFVEERAGCAACHKMFQPIGLAFEEYDDIGRFRTENEFGRKIETANEIPDSEGWSGKWENARDLVDQILASNVASTCFTGRYLTYALGQATEGTGSSCFTREVSQLFRDDALNLKTLSRAMAGHPAFVERNR